MQRLPFEELPTLDASRGARQKRVRLARWRLGRTLESVGRRTVDIAQVQIDRRRNLVHEDGAS